jgi:hypothetical protein
MIEQECMEEPRRLTEIVDAKDLLFNRRRDGKPTPEGKTTVNRYLATFAKPCVMRISNLS